MITIIAILVVMLIYLLYMCYRFTESAFNQYYCANKNVYKSILYSDVESQLKSGDLLLFSANIKAIPMTQFGHVKFSHLGLVVKINDKLYCFEMLGYGEVWEPNGDKMYGACLNPLEQRIKYYDGQVFVASLSEQLTNTQLKKLDEIIQKNVKDYNFINGYKVFFTINTKYTIKKERFCSEMVLEILYTLGLDVPPFDNMRKSDIQKYLVSRCNNTLFGYPIIIIHDDLMIKNIKNGKTIDY